MLRQIIGPTPVQGAAPNQPAPVLTPPPIVRDKEQETLRATLTKYEAECETLRLALEQQKRKHEEFQREASNYYDQVGHLEAEIAIVRANHAELESRHAENLAQLKSSETQLAKVFVVECNRKFATAVISCQVPHNEELWAVLAIGDTSSPMMNSVSVSEWGVRGNIEGNVFAAAWFHLAEAVLMLRPHGIELGGKPLVSFSENNPTELTASVFSLLEGLQSSAILAIRAASQKPIS